MAAMSNWLLTYHDAFLVNPPYKVITHTSIPTHLTLNYSTNPITPTERIRYHRGVPFTRDPHLSIEPTIPLAQEETGDTVYHTHLIPNHPSCTTVNYYFTGKVAGILSPSRSPFFSVHFTAPLLLNGSFELWSETPTRPTYWTPTETATLYKETGRVKHGQYSCRLETPYGWGFKQVALYQSVSAITYRGKQIIITAWAFPSIQPTGDNTIRLILKADGVVLGQADTTNQGWVWELLKVQAIVPILANTLTIELWRLATGYYPVDTWWDNVEL